MKFLMLLTVLPTVALLAACGRSEPPPAKTSAPQPPAQSQSRPAVLVANNFTGAEYRGGVSTKAGANGLFYFLIDPPGPAPLRAGSKLVFAKSGPASVVRVDSAPQGTKIAVFIQVDKPLDPDGDGYPHPIRVE